ncbi:protein argonaute 4A-like [Triticum dicoccoides]|nr:protein argonaute 4A-like [Triticum dicoccoides]
MGAAEGALGVEEAAGGGSPPPRLATLALARAGSGTGRRGAPGIRREAFEELVADGHVAAAAACFPRRAQTEVRLSIFFPPKVNSISVPGRGHLACLSEWGCPLFHQSIFHSNPLNIVDLGVGVMGCRGFHSSFQAAQSGLSLNTDIFITNTVKPDFPLANQMVGNLNKTHWAKAENEVNNSRIKTSPANAEYKMVCLSERNCSEQMFSLKQLEIPVYAYFVKNRGMELRYSGDFPCINVGKPKRPAYLPIELCSLAPLQSLTTLERSPFVEKSRQILLKRMSVLSDVMRCSSYGTESMLSACRIPIFQGFTQVAGRILQPPKVYSWINQNHSLKEGIILIMTWCFYHKNILGAHHGLISTYALATLVLYIFDVVNSCFTRPEVLHIFMEFFSKFDCEIKKSSLWEPVSTSYLPNVTGNLCLLGLLLFEC